MASEFVRQFTDDNFDKEVLQSKLPVLVDFWAEWCGPCRMIGPIVDEIAKEMNGKLLVGKVNVDNNSQIAARYGIQSIPTLMIFAGGELKEAIVGAQPKALLLNKITPHIINE